jgi:hypothetical protein
MYWQDSDSALFNVAEIHKLAKIFRDLFCFETEVWAIPNDNCHFQVHFKILEFAQKGTDDHLLIVYYAGQGRLTEHYRLELIG